jgi:hypothetical protein
MLPKHRKRNRLNDVFEWHRYGMKKGWVSEMFCNTHDGPPITDEEAAEWDDGGDPCSFHIRFWDA